MKKGQREEARKTRRSVACHKSRSCSFFLTSHFSFSSSFSSLLPSLPSSLPFLSFPFLQVKDLFSSFLVHLLFNHLFPSSSSSSSFTFFPFLSFHISFHLSSSFCSTNVYVWSPHECSSVSSSPRNHCGPPHSLRSLSAHQGRTCASPIHLSC